MAVLRPRRRVVLPRPQTAGGAIYLHLPLHQVEDFVASVLVPMGLDLRVAGLLHPLAAASRPSGRATAAPPRGPIHLVVDATGLKVYGEGEWTVRQHGIRPRCAWRKLHLGVDEARGQIVAQTLTTAKADDGSQVEPLRAQVQAPIEALGGDGAYDQCKVFDALAAAEPPIQPIIPPRINAKIEQYGNTKAEPVPRDEAIRAIRDQGRPAWKKTSRYHRRSIVETHIGRYKKILSDTLRARTLANQQTETRLGCALLNRMLAYAKPGSYPITEKAHKPQTEKANTTKQVFMQQSHAMVENLLARFKTELVHHQTYATRDQTRREIFEYTEGFCNTQCSHLSLGYLGPAEFERMYVA